MAYRRGAGQPHLTAARHIACIDRVDEQSGSVKGQYIDDQDPAQARKLARTINENSNLCSDMTAPLNFIQPEMRSLHRRRLSRLCLFVAVYVRVAPESSDLHRHAANGDRLIDRPPSLLGRSCKLRIFMSAGAVTVTSTARSYGRSLIITVSLKTASLKFDGCCPKRCPGSDWALSGLRFFS